MSRDQLRSRHGIEDIFCDMKENKIPDPNHSPNLNATTQVGSSGADRHDRTQDMLEREKVG